MNEFEIDEAVQRFARHPILSRASRLLKAVKNHANANSDGWASWPKPVHACERLMELLRQSEPSESEYRQAVGNVRRFYTRIQKDTRGAYPSFPQSEV